MILTFTVQTLKRERFDLRRGPVEDRHNSNVGVFGEVETRPDRSLGIDAEGLGGRAPRFG